jgi:hypothetical protein
MGPRVIVFRAPGRDLSPRVEEIPEPAHVQTLVSQSPVKALHVCILRGLAGLNVNGVDTLLDAPGQVMPRTHLRPVVPAEWIWHGTDRLEKPERGIRQRRDATGASTRRPEYLGARVRSRPRPTFWRNSDKSLGYGDGVPISTESFPRAAAGEWSVTEVLGWAFLDEPFHSKEHTLQ